MEKRIRANPSQKKREGRCLRGKAAIANEQWLGGIPEKIHALDRLIIHHTANLEQRQARPGFEKG
jgi:hypothetical protein